MATLPRPRLPPVPGLLSAAALIAAGACVPSQPLGDYGRDRASAAGSAGAAGAGGASAGLAGAGGREPGATSPEPAGLADGGGADADAEPGDSAAPPGLDAALVGPCAAGELLGPDERCYFIDASVASWAAARTTCQARGAGWDLARVRSAAQSAFLAGVLSVEGWIGASDAANESQWLWVGDAQPFWIGNGTTGAASGGAYVNWNATEPNGGTATNCARALPRTAQNPDWNAPWADLDCATQLAAICESGPNP